MIDNSQTTLTASQIEDCRTVLLSVLAFTCPKKFNEKAPAIHALCNLAQHGRKFKRAA